MNPRFRAFLLSEFQTVWLAPVFLAMLFWFIWRPGLLSPDSLDQYRQAMTMHFDDWHPPFPAIVLSLFLKLGAGMSGLMFVQAELFCIATFAVIDESARLISPDDVLPPSLRRAVELAAFLLLALMPPFPFYAMTFWKDSWTAIGLLVMTAVGLRLASLPRDGASRGRRRTLACTLTASALFAAFSRHNVVAILPLTGLTLAAAFFPSKAPLDDKPGKRLRRGAALGLLFLAPLLLYFSARALLYRIADVGHRDISVVVMAHELALACHANPETANDLPYASRALAPRYDVGADEGDLQALVDHIWWLPDASSIIDIDATRADYGRLARRHPLLLARLKLYSWLNLLNATTTPFWHQEIMQPNDLGLTFPASTAVPREALLEFSRTLRRWEPARLFLASHVLWLAISLGLSLAAILHARKHRDGRSLIILVAALTPIAYAATFLVAYAVPDFRYLYPSTLIIQSMMAGLLASVYARTCCGRPTDRKDGT